ncbi:DENN domain-containing protein 4C [Bienertia sinuspersici]
MELKGDVDVHEERPSSPLWVLHQISEEAVKVANDYFSSANTSPVWTGHKRSQSEVVNRTHRRSNSFQNLKSQISKAWRWGGNSQYENGRFNFNPEDRTKYQEPTSLFEHFIVTGLHPDANLEVVEDAFARRKKWEAEVVRLNELDGRSLNYRGSSSPSLEPQLIFKYPPGKKLPMRVKDLCAFSFPGGVKARLMERSPSLSDLNSLVYGQAADNGTLYGVCLHVPEIVQKPPTILGSSSPLCDPSMGGSRFLVAAPRCYCLLTRVPFFELHYEMLNSIISQERLNRITQFVTEMSLCDYSPSPTRGQYKSFESPSRETEWMSSAIPVDSAMALTAAAAGLITEDEVPSASNIEETHSPSNASETSDFGPFKDLYQDGKRSLQDSDDFAPDVSESCANGVGRPYENYENGTCSPETTLSSHSDNLKLERSYSSISLYSSVRSMDEDDLFSNQDSDYSGDFMTMEWAKENKNDLLQIVCAYSSLPIPQRGSEVEFQPLEHLQAIQYKRCSVSDLRIDESALDMKSSNPIKSAEINARLAAAEEAVALSVWTVATICRVLSLDNILTLLSGVLLEKQVIVVGSNLGVLSAVVLSIIPMIRPFEWQSLFLSILPAKLIDFLDAPVPIIVGIKTKPADFKIKTANLVLANVTKDQVKTCSMPLLPRRKELYSELRPIHAALAGHFRTAEKHPVYKYNEEQAEDATRFLNVMKRYMESLCADLRSYTITSVQSNNDRVSLLLKDSFIDSFSSRDRSFIKLFVDTQMFSVLSDSRLATFEHEKS